MKYYANCAFCGKLVELSRPPRYHVYCSEECKMRFKALERGITTELIHEILCEYGQLSKSELMKKLGVRDIASRNVVWWLVKYMDKCGIVVIDKSDRLNPVITLTKEWEVMCLEEDMEKFEKLAKIVGESAKRAEKLKELDDRISKLEKKVSILRDAIEKLARVILGEEQ